MNEEQGRVPRARGGAFALGGAPRLGRGVDRDSTGLVIIPQCVGGY